MASLLPSESLSKETLTSFCEQCLSRVSAVSNESSPKISSVCPICLDLFHLNTLNNILDSLRSQAQEYTTQTFNVHLILSTSQRFSELLMVKTGICSNPIALKDVFKATFLPMLSSSVCKSFSTDSPLSIHFQVQSPEADTVICDTVGKRNRKRRYKSRSGCPKVSHDINSPLAVNHSDLEAFLSLRSSDELSNFLSSLTWSLPCSLSFTLVHDPFYLFGFYKKLLRGIPQSQFPGYDTDMASEAFNPFLPLLGADSFRFESAGREDIDVRCLEGRPFVVTFHNPRKVDVSIERIRTVVEESVRPFGIVDLIDLETSLDGKTFRTFVKNAETMKKKQYRCVVHLENSFGNKCLDFVGQAFTLEQETPLRVLHRRTLLTRTRMVQIDHVEVLNQHWVLLDLTTEAGTYVKEFVHSDLGRTRPSLTSLIGCQCELKQLDVVKLII
ncbi:hypothetical protein GEMRC1_003301 [Eukaryota sp. GEM-RC1]